MKPNASPIPYGLADFVRVRTDESYYVDKTPFIPRLERVGSFLGFLRPRRFGKSLLVSMLECYYDRNRRDQFERLFKGTWIYDHPTPEQGQYLVLRLDFSMVFAQSDRVEASFATHLDIALDVFWIATRRISRMGGLNDFAPASSRWIDLGDYWPSWEKSIYRFICSSTNTTTSLTTCWRRKGGSPTSD